MDLNSRKADYWIIASIALVACAAFFLGGLAPAVFIVIALVSVWLFFRTVNRRLFSVFPQHGDLPHDHIPRRLWRVFVEVILQYRVVRDRPVVGLLHAFVLWGFFAFGWVSANHMLLGLRGLDKATGEHTAYGAFVAVWAVAVLVGMIGLSFRRFVLRPKALGKLSPTSGAVAFLISALMVTYLLGWRVFPVGRRGLESELVAPHPFIFCLAGGDPHLQAPALGACAVHDILSSGYHQLHARTRGRGRRPGDDSL